MLSITSLAVVTLLVAGGPPATVGIVERQEPDTVRVDPATVETRAQEIFRSVMSPYCPGRLLANCPSRQAAVLQDSIRNALRAGVTPEQIQDRLLVIYGDGVRPVPAFRGLGIWAWVVPGLFFIGGGALVAGWIGRRTRWSVAGTPVAAPQSTAVDDGEDAETDEQLQRELADLSGV